MDMSPPIVPPSTPQPQPMTEPPARRSLLRFLVPIAGAGLLTLVIELLYAQGVLSLCSAVRCLVPLLILDTVQFIIVPFAFAIIGARRYGRSRLVEGVLWFLLALITSLVVMVLIGTLFPIPEEQASIPVRSFEECAEAGFPIMESFPRQCRAPDGDVFTEIVVDIEPSLFPEDSGEFVVCTADAFQCPDGSWVGRTGPRCEFVCP